MSAARYWRIVAIDTYAGADLELSALHLHGGAARLDAAATIASTFTPAAGTLAALQDDDLASTCRFAGAAVRSGGFAIIWDFGAGNAADVTDLRIAGPLRDAFLARGALQYSADGRLWQWQADVAGYDWPGAEAYNTASVVGDPYYHSVSLLLPMDGANGSTAFTDSSPAPKTVTAFGNAKISTVQSKFGGASAYFDGDGDYLSASYGSDFDLSAGDFTLECFFSRTSLTGNAIYGCLLSKRLSGSDWDYGLEFNGLALAFRCDGAVAMTCGTVSLNTWHHVAVCRSGGTVYCFLDGVLQSSSAGTMRNRDMPLMIGRSLTSWPDNQFAGFIDDLRITKGVARYTANFTPPTDPSVTPAVGLPRAPAPDRVRIAASSAVPPHSALSAPPLLLARDMEFGGNGTVYGVVDRKGTPANIPLRRRVRLLSDISGAMVRETWSDATTGAFAFSGIDPAQRYTTLVYDYEHNFRAEAADNLTPEVPT